GLSAGEAAAIIVTDFCGKLVGESIDDFQRVAAAVPGLRLSEPLPGGEVPEPYRSQFRGGLGAQPYAIFQTISFERVDPKSGIVLGLFQRSATICQTTTIKADDTVARLEERLK